MNYYLWGNLQANKSFSSENSQRMGRFVSYFNREGHDEFVIQKLLSNFFDNTTSPLEALVLG